MPDVLLIANRTCPCPYVLEQVCERAGAGGRVLVVAPALNGRIKHYVSDTDESVREAHRRLAVALGWLAGAGIRADGAVGDADPLQAIEDALAGFQAAEIVIATHPPGRSHWLEKDLPRRARERSGLPVTHVASLHGLAEAA
jgi:hypothetical protein